MFGFKKRQRKRLRQQPFPDTWQFHLRQTVPYCARLSPRELAELHGHIQVFLAEKNFEGCGGLDITDEIRLTVAAHACILTLHLEQDYYPRLDTILVYPRAFVTETTTGQLGPVVVRGEQVHAGEAWQRGVVILAWDGVLSGVANDHDGYNVAFHEFAHQLDLENGAADGFPYIRDPELRRVWPHVLQKEFDALRSALDRRRHTLIDPYAAQDPAEFFAVVTETFFEAGTQLQRRHPALYEVFRLYYGHRPANKQA